MVVPFSSVNMERLKEENKEIKVKKDIKKISA